MSLMKAIEDKIARKTELEKELQTIEEEIKEAYKILRDEVHIQNAPRVELVKRKSRDPLPNSIRWHILKLLSDNQEWTVPQILAILHNYHRTSITGMLSELVKSKDLVRVKSGCYRISPARLLTT